MEESAVKERKKFKIIAGKSLESFNAEDIAEDVKGNRELVVYRDSSVLRSLRRDGNDIYLCTRKLRNHRIISLYPQIIDFYKTGTEEYEKNNLKLKKAEL